ncbi:FG-GAP-like repeat-containing protein [Streptomyces sp. NPDC090075]|uniref:FG-GAP-like repeat-containing protein n=1 Tax=Streptomyces sp. NPDC090075 TaxID=3365937 RepID=UPI003817025E
MKSTVFKRPKWLGLLLAGLLALFMAGIGAQPAFAGSDDYPSPWRAPTAADSKVDDWGYYNRECTSFVAWRLHSQNGFEMPRAIGNASGWGTWASNHGYTVNTTPAVGSVAWWSSGHVAWVEAVNGSNVTIEEYNFNFTHNYNERTIAANSVSGFIHFKDITPPSTPPPATDSDGDGILDNADSCPSDFGWLSWNWWTGCPDGRYTTAYKVSGDYNGDGKADIALLARAGYPGTNLQVFNGSSSGVTSPSLVWSDTSSWYWEGEKPIAGNFNGDQYDDLAVVVKTGDSSARVDVFFGSASGLTSPVNQWSDEWAWQNLKPIAGDFNGDGKTDLGLLARAGSSSNLWIFNGTSSGLSASPTLAWTDTWTWENLKPFAGDFNGDGKADIAMLTRAGSSSNLFVFGGTSSGPSSSPTLAWTDTWTWENVKPFAGDFNGDGKTDIAMLTRCGSTCSNLLVFGGASSGYVSSPTLAVNNSWAWDNLKPLAGDFNGDGKADIAMLAKAGSSSNLLVFNGASSGWVGSPSLAWTDTWAWENLRLS